VSEIQYKLIISGMWRDLRFLKSVKLANSYLMGTWWFPYNSNSRVFSSCYKDHYWSKVGSGA